MTKDRTKGEWRKLGRRQGYRVMAPERHLIVCEDERAAPLYFAGMRDALKPEFRNRIHIAIKETGLCSVDLLNFAFRENWLLGGFDHVWLAYDHNDFDSREFDSLVVKCAQNSNGVTTFHPLWSNPCFEVWMLLHFDYTSAEMTSAEVISKVDAVYCRELRHPYAKAAEDEFAELLSRMHTAENNADQLKAWHESQSAHLPSKMNPGTAMPEITKMLSDYIGGDSSYV